MKLKFVKKDPTKKVIGKAKFVKKVAKPRGPKKPGDRYA